MKIRTAVGLGSLTTIVIAGGCGGPDLSRLLPNFRTELGHLSQQAQDADQIAVTGIEGWLFFGPELRHLSLTRFWGPEAAYVSRARRSEDADPMPAILDFAQQLGEHGIELLMVPVPPKAIIFPEKISEQLEVPIPVPRLDPALEELYGLLRANGIDVLDLTDHFIMERFHSEGPLYCRTDTHWSGSGCTTAAAAIAANVRNRSWYDTLDTEAFAASWYSTSITGDLAPATSQTPTREELRLRGIVAGSGRNRARVSPDPNSPIILLGDSHNLVFHAGDDMHSTGAGLPDQLAFELGLRVDLVAVRGSGATPARVNLLRRAQTNANYWEQKLLVIWCFAAREFSESDGWRLVPIAP